MGAMGRMGVVGELLIMAALLASTFVLVDTFSERDDTPNVPQESIESLRDVRTILSQAVLNWLRDGVVEQPLACNGQYLMQPDDPAFLDKLRPYVDDALNTALEDGGSVRVAAGDIQEISFEGLEGLTITLTNGTVIYNDTNVYAQNSRDQEFLFNARLPLVMTVAQDWVKCDSGNMSQHLIESFGDVCFYGIKSPRYPGCPKNPKHYAVDDVNRGVIGGNAITSASVADGVQSSIDELNAYFNGTSSCEAPLIPDTGITCTFELQAVEFYNKMHPYSSWDVVVTDPNAAEIITRGALNNMPDVLEFQEYISQDEHLYALPAAITSYPYTDQQLADPPRFSCTDTGRTPVETVIRSDPVPDEQGMVDIMAQTSTTGYPALYVNTTRGAKFTVIVTCRDNRVSLLGQPLEYSFKIRHGLKQHCGPQYTRRGSVACMGCADKPGLASKCIDYSKPAPCMTYYEVCRDRVLWEWNKRGEGVTAASISEGNELFNDVCDMCGSVLGPSGWIETSSCPKPTEEDLENQNCMDPYAYVCCNLDGFKKDCSPELTITNPVCFIGDPAYTSLCTAPKCQGSVCVKQECVAETGECKDTGYNPGVPCAACSKCTNTGACAYDTSTNGQSCGQSYDQCEAFKCDEASKSCKATPIKSVGDSCSIRGDSGCAKVECISLAGGERMYCGENRDKPLNEGGPCGQPSVITTATERCTTTYTCVSGSCSGSTTNCVPIDVGTGGCTPPKTWNGERCV